MAELCHSRKTEFDPEETFNFRIAARQLPDLEQPLLRATFLS
jgi:hypothetical protein